MSEAEDLRQVVHGALKPLLVSMLEAIDAAPLSLTRGGLFRATRAAHPKEFSADDFEQVFRGARTAGLITWNEAEVRDAESCLTIHYDLTDAGVRYLAETSALLRSGPRARGEAEDLSGVAVAILIAAALLAAVVVARLVFHRIQELP